ncbi:MAG: hypothetical protein ACXWVH_08735 [Caulobacteraceae bacterium]
MSRVLVGLLRSISTVVAEASVAGCDAAKAFLADLVLLSRGQVPVDAPQAVPHIARTHTLEGETGMQARRSQARLMDGMIDF